jgi:hypothetical protein
MAQLSRNRRNRRRGGRVVDGSGLENRQGESPRGFESHPLRSLLVIVLLLLLLRSLLVLVLVIVIVIVIDVEEFDYEQEQQR